MSEIVPRVWTAVAACLRLQRTLAHNVLSMSHLLLTASVFIVSSWGAVARACVRTGEAGKMPQDTTHTTVVRQQTHQNWARRDEALPWLHARSTS